MNYDWVDMVRGVLAEAGHHPKSVEAGVRPGIVVVEHSGPFGGFVSLYFEGGRGFVLGAANFVPGPRPARYTGQGWPRRLILDGWKKLDDVMRGPVGPGPGL